MKLQELIRIQLPNEEVFAYMMEIENRSAYIPLLEEVILLDPLPLRLGSRYTEVSTIAGRKLNTTYQVINFIKNKNISVKTIESVFPIQVSLSLIPVEQDTVLKLQMNLELSGVFRLAAPLIKGIVQQQAKDILQSMKQQMEAK